LFDLVQHRCPHCGEGGISGVRKFFLGPLRTTSCSRCGRPVSIPYWSIVIVVPWLIALVMVLAIPDRALYGFWLGSLSVVLMSLIWAGFVPLVKR
jgi:hypothetical protein